MALGPAIALCVGISLIYGGMLAAVLIGLRYAERHEDDQH